MGSLFGIDHDSPQPLASMFTEFQKRDIEQSIVSRFEEQVVRHSHRIAIKTPDHKFTYDDLNKTANRIARVILKWCGEGADPIPLMLEHGAPMLAAIFGVLKAGKIYVPLDPNLPDARIRYILGDLQTKIIVANNKHFHLASELSDSRLQVFNIDEIDPGISEEDPNIIISPDALAYIIYTSGSTGRPKGVVENHRNVLHGVMGRTNEFHITPDDRIAILTSLSFAGSIRKIFPALLNGASIYPLDVKKEGIANLPEWLIQEGITILGGRAVLRELLSILTGDEKFSSIRIVSMSGDTIYRRDIELCRKIFSPDAISIGLGGTEFGAATRYYIDNNMQLSDSILPAGYAVEDKKILILDEKGSEVGFDQIGEIAVKSRYLSPGYWRRPELTQARFLPDPDGGDERIYLTGDMGRMTPDGCVFHAGRIDFQVKVRGYRVETAEVEAALLNLGTINMASVVAREERPGNKLLVAYIVPKSKPALTVTALRRVLREELPEYMIPSIFVVMDELPLTATGKVDRLALPTPDAGRPELEAVFVAPRDEMEFRLARIWEEILSIDSIGVHDNFFDLGGHSLLAVQMFSRVEKIFSRRLPLVALLHAPTIEQLADILRQKEWSPPWSSLVKIQSGGSKPPIFCIHACNGDVLFYTDLARHLGEEQPFYALRARGLDENQAPHTRIEDMATHYISEIRSVQPEGPYILGGSGVGGMIAFEMAQQLVAQKQRVDLLVLIDTGPPRHIRPDSQGTPGHYIRRSIYHMRNGQLIRALGNRLRRYNRKIRLMLKPIHIQRLRNALETAPLSYKPKAYKGKVIYFLSEKREKTRGDAQAAIGEWYRLSTDGLTVFRIPGDHLDILKEPYVKIVAEHLNACLDETQHGDSESIYERTTFAL